MSFLLNSFSKTLDYPDTLTITSTSQTYNVLVGEFSKKHSSVVVKGDCVEVRLSSRLSFSQKQRHIDELLASISKKLEKITPREPQLTFQDIVARGYFEFAGITYLFAKHQGRGIKRSGRTWYLGQKSSFENLEKKFLQLLLIESTPIIKQRVALINANSFKYSYGRVDVKLVHSKWGHCSFKNDLLFNIKLLNAPLDVLDYVIYHELAHIKEKNHSKRFWDLVAQYCPNFKELRKTLKLSPPRLYK